MQLVVGQLLRSHIAEVDDARSNTKRVQLLKVGLRIVGTLRDNASGGEE
jgi:hypothetical protein